MSESSHRAAARRRKRLALLVPTLYLPPTPAGLRAAAPAWPESGLLGAVAPRATRGCRGEHLAPTARLWRQRHWQGRRNATVEPGTLEPAARAATLPHNLLKQAGLSAAAATGQHQGGLHNLDLQVGG